MRPALHAIVSLALALTVAMTSVTVALARGQVRDAGGNIIICSGAGAVSVALDGDGNPTGPVHVCPDCALFALGHVGAPFALARPVLTGSDLVFAALAAPLGGCALPIARARAPPVA